MGGAECREGEEGRFTRVLALLFALGRSVRSADWLEWEKGEPRAGGANRQPGRAGLRTGVDFRCVSVC